VGGGCEVPVGRAAGARRVGRGAAGVGTA
jgi:hypothetical protein